FILTAIGVIGVLIGILVPLFAAILDAAGRDLPGPTRLLLAISNAAADYGGFALVGLGLGLLGLLAVRATPKGRAALDRFALRVPGLGGLLRDLAVARLTRTLNGLLGGGLALDRALPITADVMTNTAFANLVRASERVVRAGEPFWRSLRGSGLMRPRDVELIRLGEENGALEPMTARLASMAERDAQRRIDRGLSLLTPVLTLVMGLIAGFIIVSLLSAILGLNDLV
ncbi:MAG: type II secretion system F family protein, partial [Maricaulaceae bacterium]